MGAVLIQEVQHVLERDLEELAGADDVCPSVAKPVFPVVAGLGHKGEDGNAALIVGELELAAETDDPREGQLSHLLLCDLEPAVYYPLHALSNLEVGQGK